MAVSTLITDYLGTGTHAARPATPPVAPGGTAIYTETDTNNTFIWLANAWVQLNGGSSGGGGGGVTTVGFNSVTGFTGFGGGNYGLARVFVTDNFTLSSIGCLIQSAVTGANVYGVVYADNAGYASGALLGQSAEIANLNAGQNLLPLQTPVALIGGTFYWVGILLTGAGVTIAQQSPGLANYSAGTSTPQSPGPNMSPGSGYLFYGHGLSASGAGGGDTWNTTLIGPGPTASLSTDNRTAFAASPSGWSMVQGTETYVAAAGKIYWEYQMSGTNTDGFVGACGPGAALNTYCGNSSGFGRGYDGGTHTAWGGSATNGNGWPTQGVVLGVALDIPNGNVTYYFNGVADGGVTGMTIPSSGIVHAASFQTTKSGQSCRMSTTASQCVFAPPTGFSYCG